MVATVASMVITVTKNVLRGVTNLIVVLRLPGCVRFVNLDYMVHTVMNLVRTAESSVNSIQGSVWMGAKSISMEFVV